MGKASKVGRVVGVVGMADSLADSMGMAVLLMNHIGAEPIGGLG